MFQFQYKLGHYSIVAPHFHCSDNEILHILMHDAAKKHSRIEENTPMQTKIATNCPKKQKKRTKWTNQHTHIFIIHTQWSYSLSFIFFYASTNFWHIRLVKRILAWSGAYEYNTRTINFTVYDVIVIDYELRSMAYT